MPANQRAFCVDLDGTLLRSDLLHESLLALIARNPLYVLLLPFWLLGGKAAFKRQIASRIKLHPELLPYDERVLEALRTTDQRPRVLCTASDELLAQKIAEHLGLFEATLASNGKTNLGGTRKAEALISRFGNRGFDYAGNNRLDLKVWCHAGDAIVVGGTSLARAAGKITTVREHFLPIRGGIRTWIRQLRLYQWSKNLLVVVPLLASHRFLETEAALQSLVAFIAFGLCASGTYALNDLLDLVPDRQHPRKRARPFAAGTLPVLHGMIAVPVLTLAAFALALLCSPMFALALLAYFAMTLGYSLKLKRIVMVDVVLLAALYTVRIIGGSLAIGSALSFWLLAFSMFVFLSLALLKRYTELNAVLAEGREGASGRGYGTADLPLIQSLGAASGYIGVLVLALYINSPESLMLYERPELLWLLCPVVLYWISRMWVVSHRGVMHDDPIVFAATDRVSQIVVLVCAAIVLAAT